MKINNRASIKTTVVWLMIFTFIDAVLNFVLIMLGTQNELSLIISGALVLLLLWRLLRIFDIEITEYVLVIIYHHPLLTKHHHPILELPTIATYDLQIENSMKISFFIIVLSKRNNYKTFCYRLDLINKDQITLLQKNIISLLDTDINSNFLNYDS